LFSFESEGLLVDDREDLITVLQMRFGQVTGEIIEKVYEINDMNTLQRLILSAANAPCWDVFVEELGAGKRSFRIVGENFNPLGEFVNKRGDVNGKREK
jgi:hypothetical protein